VGPVHLREEFGEDPDLDAVYDHVLSRMQASLDHMARDRILPLLG
jgi:hypothetical protein